VARNRNPLAPSLTVRQTLFALLVTGLSLLALGGAIGFAAAGDGAASGEVPDTLSLPKPNRGDHGTYTVTVVEPNAGGFTIVEPERVYARFEWTGDAIRRDSEGIQRRVHMLDYENHKLGDDGQEQVMHELVHYDAATGNLVAYSSTDSSSKLGSLGGGLGAAEVSQQERYDMRFALHPNDPTQEWQPLLLCGLRNAFQGHELALDEALVPFTVCEVQSHWVEGGWYRAVATEDVGGRAAVAFTQLPRGYNGRGGGGDSHFWLSEDLPYVLRIAVQDQERPSRYFVFRLAEFARGAVPLATDVPAPDPLPPVTKAPRRPWGPDDGDLKDHPFPLREAFERARDDPGNATLRNYLSAHPDAYTAYARYTEDVDEPVLRRQWMFHLTAGDGGLTTCIREVTEPQRAGPVPVGALGTSTRYEYGRCGYAAAFPAPSLVPSEVPTVGSLLARWTPYEGPDRVPNGWTYHVGCNNGPCTAAIIEAGPSFDRTAFASTGGPPPLPYNQTQTSVTSVVTFDGDGRAVKMEASEYRFERSPKAAPPSSPPETADIHVESLNIETWVFPQGRYAIATGSVAALVGLVFWLWPSLKGALSFGLFSRVQRDSALDQATRSQLHALVEANPGIHFQEIVRRSGRGQGTVDHHLRKLVDVGLLVRQQAPGFVCFFPKGSVDRRVMAAAPVLKADGARAVLEAVAARPGLSGLGIGAVTGLDRGTVSYHLRRLSQAALVTIERAGRELRVNVTETGRLALSAGSAA
jgi:predicted transcriptional regulator